MIGVKAAVVSEKALVIAVTSSAVVDILEGGVFSFLIKYLRMLESAMVTVINT